MLSLNCFSNLSSETKELCNKCGKEMIVIMDEPFGLMFLCECGHIMEKRF